MGKGNALRLAVLMRGMLLEHLPDQLKYIFWPLEREPLINLEFLEMLEKVASRQMIDPGKVLASVLPSPLRKTPSGWLDRDKKHNISFSSGLKDMQFMSKAASKWQSDHWILNYGAFREDPFFAVAKNPPWKIPPRASLQWSVMDMLWHRGAQPRSRIRSALGQGAARCIQSLLKKKLICSVQHQTEEDDTTPEPAREYALSPDQHKALNQLAPRLEQEKFHAAVLHGITGSGKSLVYLKLARKCLENGRSAILLAPEIAIARQLYRYVRQFLPGAAALLHHGLNTPRKKENIFSRVRWSEGPVLLVGTRSALFMPMRDIGLIVLDEEHDESYKQDQSLIYQAKEVAYYLARRDRALLVLGSATPDIKTYHAAIQSRIELVQMHHRIGSSTLPSVEFVDLKKYPPDFGSLSKGCADILRQTLERGEQAVIMHNRRGYAPIIMCADCSETVLCKSCRVALTYHKKRNRLVCHYCGGSLPFPPVCEHCRGSECVPVGQGTEKLEEYLSRHLPGTSVLRLDRDSTRNSGKARDILENFAAGKAQILVGTQMLSKGHSFPDVTLAIVPDADLGLGLPDYRSTERIFQLLVQLSGRAGRGEKAGRVFIQTRNPEHFCWKYIRDCDYEGFFSQEIQRRQTFDYPPFVKLGLIRFSFPASWPDKQRFLADLRQRASEAGAHSAIRLLGPAPALLSRLKDRERYHFLIKSDDWISIKRVYLALRPLFEEHRQLRFSLDLDPVNML